MKKLFPAVLLLSIFVVLLSGCGITRDDLDDEWEDGCEYGYESGYADGYDDAMQKVPAKIEDRVEFDIEDLCYEIKKKYGIHPEDAANILSIYADVPDEVTEEELIKAIWAIYKYYHGASDIINGISDYYIID